MLHDVDVQMVIGHGDAGLVETGADLLVQGETDSQIVCRFAPAVDLIGDTALAVAVHHNGGRGVRKDLIGAADGFQQRLADRLGRIVIGGGNGQFHAAAAQLRIVDDLFAGESPVGDHDAKAAGGVQGCVGQSDFPDGAVAAGDRDVVPVRERLGGQDYQSAGHVGQDCLHSQCDGKGQDAQKRHHRGDGDAEAVSHDQRCDDQQQDPQSGQHVPGDVAVQFCAGEDLLQDGHDDLHRDQTDHKRQQGIEQNRKGQRTEKLAEQGGRGFVCHGKVLL